MIFFKKVEQDPNDELRKILCERCRKFFPMGQIKYVPTGNDSRMALCMKCMNIPIEDRKKNAESSRVPYFCVRCKYKFKYNPDGLHNAKCPYCGQDDKLVEDRAGNTTHLIKEVDVLR
jgi:transcription initiation factor IIE alpha subunit